MADDPGPGRAGLAWSTAAVGAAAAGSLLVPGALGWMLLWALAPLALAVFVTGMRSHGRFGATWPQAAWNGLALFLAVGLVWFLWGPGDDTGAGHPVLLVLWPSLGFMELAQWFGVPGPE